MYPTVCVVLTHSKLSQVAMRVSFHSPLPDGSSRMQFSNLLNLSSALQGWVVEQIYLSPNKALCIFPLFWRGNFLWQLKWQLSFCLIVQLEGWGKESSDAYSNTSGQNKSFLRRHHVIHLPVNDTFSLFQPSEWLCLCGPVSAERKAW